MGNIASLDPAITSTGRRGLRAASANDRAMWAEMNDDWDRFAMTAHRALMQIEHSENQIAETPYEYAVIPTGEDRLITTTQRIGQDFFRGAVLSAYRERCCITGLAIPRFLEAAHIVPWSHDPANRTNPQNGLALTVLHHKAFDAGVITVSQDMAVRVSQSYAHRGDEFFNRSIGRYARAPITLPEKFAPNEEFLAFHREYIFQD